MDNRDHPQFGSGSRGASSDSTSFPRSSIAEWTSSGTADNVHRMPRLFRSLHITLPTSAAWVVRHSGSSSFGSPATSSAQADDANLRPALSAAA